jgi:glyoxylase-like metal-dependent hydrolase (beta-lactamase superfamily II)
MVVEENRHMRVFLAVTLALGVAGAAFAQPRTADPAKRGLKPGDLPRIIKITDNVYGYEGIHNSGMPTVSLIVIGNDGVLIADGQGSPDATQKLLDAIAKVTAKPVKWYVVGSDHGDHTAGNSVLPKDITYVVSPASKAQLERDATTAKPPRVVIVPPVAMTLDKQVIDVGGTEVQVLNLGRAHTGGDLSVYLPKQGILFMSEAYLNRVFPAMRSAYPREWLKTLDKAIAMNARHYIPGHGFIEDPKVARDELLEYRKALEYVISEVNRLHKLGLSADDARKQANWGSYRDWMLSDSQDIIAIRKVYEEIEGKLPSLER